MDVLQGPGRWALGVGSEGRWVHKLACQPIQQFRVGRTGAHETEVVGGLDDASSEVVLPETVYDDSRDERGLKDALSELKATAARTGKRLGRRAARLQEAARNLISQVRGAASHMHAVLFAGAVVDRHGVSRLS